MSAPDPLSVAIVGIGCLFPGAPDLASYWRNILAATDCITDVPPDHSWSVHDYYDPDPAAPDKTWATRGGFLPKMPFDPLAFGIPPNMLESIDTSQLLSLIVAREALKDAGIDPDDEGWDRDRVACIVGVTGTQEMAITAGARLQGPTWRRSMLRCGVDPALVDVVVADIANHFPTWTEQTFPGLLGNVVAGRIANRLDLGGTNCVVDAACASSLAAVQYAASELLAGRCDLVLTGGVDTLNDIFMFECFTRTPAFTRAGDARPFDASADGILIGEGIGLCALKRLADAERDGDRIYAVIRGLGASSDGRHRSIYAPNPDGQAKALRRTYAMAGVEASTIELVEAHGTGTKAGDIAEITALARVFRESDRPGRWCALGTVKSQIGHTKSTAGAAGLIKVALALHQRVLPPTAKIETPNPKMGFEDSPLYLNPRARPWIRAADHPRRAAVSAFGFGGSNFHALLEEHGAPTVAAQSPAQVELFLIGADSSGALERALEQLGGPTVTHAAHEALARWSAGQPWVAAFLAGSLEELTQRIAIVRRRLQGSSPRPGDEVWLRAGDDAPAPRVAWLFPGQGAQYVEMGRTLALRHPAVRAAMDRAEEAFRARSWPSLAAILFPPPAFSEAEATAQADALRDTAWAQPAIGALSRGMADLLAEFGLSPDVVAGHSYGELVALSVAGALPGDALWIASRLRGERMSEGGARGTMAAVDGPLDRIQAIVDGIEGVVLANRNHPEQGVISGDHAGIHEAIEALEAEGLPCRRLAVGAAFHSPLLAPASGPFLKDLADVRIQPPRIEVISCTQASPWPTDPHEIRAQLADQITQPVDWIGVVDGLLERGVQVVIECGPRGVLCGLVERCAGSALTVIGLDRAADRSDGDTQLKRALAAMAVAGLPVDPAPLLRERLPPLPPEASSPATVWLAGANHRQPDTLEPPMPELPVTPRTAHDPMLVPASPTPVAASAGAAPAAPQADAGWGAVPSSGAPMDRPVYLERADAQPTNPAPGPAATPNPAAAPDPAATGITEASVPHAAQPAISGSDLAALLESTRQTLVTFQRAQEKTAEVHGRFLDGVARANDSFARLFEAQARLVEQAAGRPATPSLAPRPRPVPDLIEPPRAPAAQAAPAPSPVAQASTTPSPGAQAAPLPGLLEASPEGETGRVRLSSATTAVATDLPPIFDAQAAVEARSAPSPAASDPVPLPSGPSLQEVLLSAVADKTGYPIEALELSMDLESDLGVDSIKRVEILGAVRERLPGLPELDNERLAALRTLADVAGELEGIAPSSPSPEPRGPSLREALLSAVADKTGYPIEALELSMDLESDLGVDSIKRVEILGAVRERLPGLPELDNERLAALRTLADVADHLASEAAGLGFATIGASTTPSGQPALLVPPPPPPPQPQPRPQASLPPVQSASDLLVPGALPPALQRAEVSVSEAPPGDGWIPGPRWLLARDDHGVAEALADEMRGRGLQPTLIDPFTDAPDLPEGSFDAVVCLSALGAPPEVLSDRLRGAFLLAKATGPVQRFVTVSGRGGRLGRGPDAGGDPLEGALSGLAKTLSHEWPGTRPLALDLAPGLDPSAILDEILTARPVVELGLGEAGAVTPVAHPVRPPPPAAALPLEPGDLIVVTGGARGVTARCVDALVRRVPVAVLLLGRTPVPDADPPWAASIPDDDLPAAFISAHPGAPPREAGAAAHTIRATREIRANLERLRAHGAPVRYVSLDAREPAAVAEAITAAVGEHGPVRGLIHGAGVLADRALADKTPEQFDQVWSTKVDGLSALLRACDQDELRAVVLFSSIAGREGNAGQVDYAMANEALVQVALDLQRQRPRATIKAIDWGPWDGGMVTPGLKEHFAALGRGLIPLDAGAEAAIDELSSPCVEVVIEGQRPARGVELRELSADAPWLAAHRIQDRPVLPAAMVLEWMFEIATRVAPSLVAQIHDLAILRGVVLEGPSTQVEISWAPVRPERGEHALAIELRETSQPRPAYRAIVELSTPVPDPPGRRHEANGLGNDPYPYALSDAYQRFLFHGPALQGIDQIVGMSDHGAVAWLKTSTPATLGIAGRRWSTDPLTLDSALQLMLLWVREKHGAAALPTQLGQYSQLRPLAGRVACHLEIKPGATGQHGRFGLTLVDESGEILAELSGGEYAAGTSLIPAFRAK
ncbi:MAG TPA: SDR family NAD(P)-dependent oxidoreductase [Deltaproteobacteria bacterium]|nr:SDR family NAD(P)-dependent oxidoreductase [Deltaproteobacteria bacterium]